MDASKKQVKSVPLVTPSVFAEIMAAIVANAARDRRQASGK